MLSWIVLCRKIDQDCVFSLCCNECALFVLSSLIYMYSFKKLGNREQKGEKQRRKETEKYLFSYKIESTAKAGTLDLSFQTMQPIADSLPSVGGTAYGQWCNSGVAEQDDGTTGAVLTTFLGDSLTGYQRHLCCSPIAKDARNFGTIPARTGDAVRDVS